jgi:hypothetical protein
MVSNLAVLANRVRWRGGGVEYSVLLFKRHSFLIYYITVSSFLGCCQSCAAYRMRTNCGRSSDNCSQTQYSESQGNPNPAKLSQPKRIILYKTIDYDDGRFYHEDICQNWNKQSKSLIYIKKTYSCNLKLDPLSVLLCFPTDL